MQITVPDAQSLVGFVALAGHLNVSIETAIRLDGGAYRVACLGTEAALDGLDASGELLAYLGQRSQEVAEVVHEAGMRAAPEHGHLARMRCGARTLLGAVVRSARWTVTRAAERITDLNERLLHPSQPRSSIDRASLVSAGVPERTANALFAMAKGLPGLPRDLRRNPDPCRVREWVASVAEVAAKEGPGPLSRDLGTALLPTWAIAHFAFEANIRDQDHLARLFGLRVPERNWLMSIIADAEAAGAASLSGTRRAQLVVLVEHDHRATSAWGRLRRWVRLSQAVGGPATAGGVAVLLLAGQLLPGLTLMVAAATLLSQVEYRVTIVTREARLFRRAAIDKLRGLNP